MFKEEYKNAYNDIKADPRSVNKILECAKGKNPYRKKQRKWQPAIIALLLTVTLCVGVNIPTLAEEVTQMIQIWETGMIDYTLYKSLQRNGTKIHSYIPEYTMIRKDGIIMNVELAMFRDKEFIAYLSFTDEEGHNLIHKDGTYNWNSISVKIGEKVLKHQSMKFLKYDEAKDKVYYVYTASTGTSKLPEGEIVHIEINGFFESSDRKESVDLSNIPLEADTRVVKILHSSVDETLLTLENTEYPYMASVLNITPLSEVKIDTTSITGVAYIDGALRVQISKPDNGVADHFSETAYIEHYNSSGEQILPEQRQYIYWYEKIDGQLMEFIETYYVMPEENVRELPLVVNIHEKRGCIHTTWEVDFEVE